MNVSVDGLFSDGACLLAGAALHFTSLSGSLIPGCHHETLSGLSAGNLHWALPPAVSRIPGWSRSVFRASSFLTLSQAQGYSARCLPPRFFSCFSCEASLHAGLLAASLYRKTPVRGGEAASGRGFGILERVSCSPSLRLLPGIAALSQVL